MRRTGTQSIGVQWRGVKGFGLWAWRRHIKATLGWFLCLQFLLFRDKCERWINCGMFIQWNSLPPLKSELKIIFTGEKGNKHKLFDPASFTARNLSCTCAFIGVQRRMQRKHTAKWFLIVKNYWRQLKCPQVGDELQLRYPWCVTPWNLLKAKRQVHLAW